MKKLIEDIERVEKQNKMESVGGDETTYHEDTDCYCPVYPCEHTYNLIGLKHPQSVKHALLRAKANGYLK